MSATLDSVAQITIPMPLTLQGTVNLCCIAESWCNLHPVVHAKLVIHHIRLGFFYSLSTKNSDKCFTNDFTLPDSSTHNECGLPLSTRVTRSFLRALMSTYTVVVSGQDAPYRKNDFKIQ